MKIIFKKIIIILLGINMMGCNLFAGLLFPKKIFRFSPVGEQPPASSTERLKAGDRYPQTFTSFISRAGNSFEYYFVPTIFVNKPYKVCHIKEMKYEWENNAGILLKDKDFELPINHYRHNAQNGWYWLGGLGRGLPEINFEKIFQEKNPDDEFSFRLILVYTFDDGPENTQVLEYDVTVEKGEYFFPFYF